MTEHTKIPHPYRIKLQGSGYYPYHLACGLSVVDTANLELQAVSRTNASAQVSRYVVVSTHPAGSSKRKCPTGMQDAETASLEVIRGCGSRYDKPLRRRERCRVPRPSEPRAT